MGEQNYGKLKTLLSLYRPGETYEDFIARMYNKLEDEGTGYYIPPATDSDKHQFQHFFPQQQPIHIIPNLPISENEYKDLNLLLLDLGLDDHNSFVADAYFELLRRSVSSTYGPHYYLKNDTAKENKLYNIGICAIPKTIDGNTSKESNDFKKMLQKDSTSIIHPSDPLPIQQETYCQLLRLLGTLSIQDHNNYSQTPNNYDTYEKKQSQVFPRLFIYLQNRAKKGNKFDISDKKILEIEEQIKKILTKHIDKDHVHAN